MVVGIVNLNGDYSKLIYELDRLGATSIVTRDEAQILKTDKIIIPGSGEAFSAIKRLNMYNLGNVLKISKNPVLGISLGMEVLCEYSDEGNVFCLGCIPGEVKKLPSVKGANPLEYFATIVAVKDSPLLEGLCEEEKFYFRHAYYVPTGEETVAVLKKDRNISAVIQNNNYYGVQFFPERSGDAGKKVLENFLYKC